MTASRGSLFIFFPILSLIWLLLSACAANVILRASPGETPGITLVRSPGDGWPPGQSKISAESQNAFAGLLDFNPSCCYDAIRDRAIQLPTLDARFFPAAVDLPANGSDSTMFLLRISWDSNNEPLGIPYGKYLVQVNARKRVDGSLAQTTQVGLRVLPDGEPHSDCRPDIRVLPTAIALGIEINATENQPRTKTLQIAIVRVAPPNGAFMEWTIEDAPGRSSTESAIVLENETGSQKAITTTGCSSNGQTLTVQPGQTGHVIIVQGVDRTLVFQQRVCHDPFCWGWHMQDLDVFSEKAFWSVFGGKKMTFRWVQDY